MKPTNLKRKPLSRALSLQWAQLAHSAYLDALMSVSGWAADQFAFHGGTSLHLSWNSPRFSEDLDFLLSKDVDDIQKVATKVLGKVRERLRLIDPAFDIDIKDSSKDPNRMIVYAITISKADYLGKALVKAEFWRTDSEYLRNYPKQFRTPAALDGVLSRFVNPIPAAALETAYADKLTAFATRPRLKWRDIFDLWWIGTQSSSTLDILAVRDQFLHNVQAYTTVENKLPSEALRLFFRNDPQELIARADPDLKRWLPTTLWTSLYPTGIEQMVTYVFYALDAVAHSIEHPRKSAAHKADLKSIPLIRLKASRNTTD